MLHWNSIWQKRYDQRIQECEKLLQSLQLDSHHQSQEDHGEVNLLRASLLRFFGKMEESEQSLNQVDTQTVNLKRFHLQKAFNYFIVGNYIQASIYFKKVLADKITDYESYLAQMNLIFCMDNMGLDTSMYLEELHEIAKKLSVVLPLHHDQILSLQLRNNFKQNRPLHELFHVQSQKPAQSIYLKLWLESLPYMKNKVGDFNFDQEFSRLLNADILFKEYRIETLLGKESSLEAAKNVKISELIDRLYLWTWYWLDEKLPISLLENTILQIKEHPQISSLSAEDILLLKNALGWIELFTCRMDLFRQLPITLAQGSFGAPIYEKENILIQSLLSKKYQSTNSDSDFITEKLRLKIETHFATPDKLKSDQVIVHLKTGRIVSDTSSVCMEAACFIHMSQSAQAVSFENVLFYCFGIKTYDPSVHYSKISNLVQKLKKNYSEIYDEVMVNNNHVHFKMKNRNFHFILDGEVSLSRILEKSSKVELINLGKKTTATILSIFRKNPTKGFSQSELTLTLNQSKATVVRALKKEIDKGSIVKVGQGKNTIYQLKENL